MTTIDFSRIITAETRAAEDAAARRAAVVSAIEAHVEEVARARGYRSAESCAGYLASTVAAWAAEAQAFIAWRDGVWSSAFAALAAVGAGARDMPTPTEATAEIAPIAWPS